ncbi:MAG TPA: hypothetical protein ENI95_07570 [Chloroflexi bacterium]|nr:hypothetical protein [Chloroflexota bacterium]
MPYRFIRPFIVSLTLALLTSACAAVPSRAEEPDSEPPAVTQAFTPYSPQSVAPTPSPLPTPTAAPMLESVPESMEWVQTPSIQRELYVAPDGFASDLRDYSGQGRDGLFTSFPAFVSGHVVSPEGVSQALQLDGVDDFIEFSPPVAAWGSSATLMTWFATTAEAAPLLSSMRSPSGLGVGQSLQVRQGRIAFFVSENGNLAGCEDDSVLIEGPPVNDGEWHHAAAVIDQTANEVYLYLDGEPVGSESIASIDDAGCGIEPITRIGLSRGGVDPTYYEGTLDELRIYDRALNAEEIGIAYGGGAGSYDAPDAGLVLGYHFDEEVAGTPDNPLSLEVAIRSAQPGDLYWLLEGTYRGAFELTRPGTETSPIIYRAYPGQHVRVEGGFDITADHNWLWGLEITDPEQVRPGAGVTLQAAGVHLINNYVHHVRGYNGIEAWNEGPGQVIYGNIVYLNGYDPGWLEDGSRQAHPHNIYTQNRFADNGYKYFVNNLILDSGLVCDDCFNFHAYTEDGYVSGFHLENNVIANGRVLIGGFNEPSDNHRVIGNRFYNSNVQFGYRRPTQAWFISNHLFRSMLSIEWFWGAGETRFTQTAPNIFLSNTILAPEDVHIRFRTSAYLEDGRNEGGPAIQPTDIFGRNIYSEPFSAYFYANGQEAVLDFEGWQAATREAGNPFDGDSEVVPLPTETEIFLLPNEYEEGRAHLVIYNWGNEASVAVDLSSVLPSGASFAIYRARDLYGTPEVSGTYSGPVSVSVEGEEFATFVVVSIGP